MSNLLYRVFCHFLKENYGESARLPPMCPGLDSRARRHMWVEFVGSVLCSERFSTGTPVFPSPENLI